MKRVAFWFLVVLVLMNVPASNLLGRELLVACGDDRVLVIDKQAAEGSDHGIIWEWKAVNSPGLPASYRPLMRTIDECKPVDSDQKILATSSSGGVVLIERDTGKSIFYAQVPNAHSAEYLPGGRIAVALSTAEGGNSIELYDESLPEKVLYRNALYSGHGVVWMPLSNRLFALGGKELRAYSLSEWESGSPKLILEKSWELPGEGGHDLSPVSGDRLLLTTVDGVWEFDVAQESFQPFSLLEGVRNVKSINFEPATGRLIFTKAEESWWTENIYCRNPEQVITIPGMKLYKVRVMEEASF